MFEKELRRAVEDAKEFINKNRLTKDGVEKRWFININHKNAFVKLHPEGGKIDIQNEVSKRFYDHKNSELRDLRSGKTFWYGMFDSILEAAGFALLISKIYKRQTEHKLRVTGCIDDMICEPLDPF